METKKINLNENNDKINYKNELEYQKLVHSLIGIMMLYAYEKAKKKTMDEIFEELNFFYSIRKKIMSIIKKIKDMKTKKINLTENDDKKIALAIFIYEKFNCVNFEKNNKNSLNEIENILKNITKVKDYFYIYKLNDNSEKQYLVFDENKNIFFKNYLVGCVYNDNVDLDFNNFVKEYFINKSLFLSKYDGIENKVKYNSKNFSIYKINN